MCRIISCDFGVLKEELIRDIIVIGVKNDKLSETLQLDSELTLENAIAKARQSETVREQQSVVRQTENKIEVIKSGARKKNITEKTKMNKDTEHKHNGRNKMCSKCGAIPFHPWFKCPANDKICSKCKRRGHYAKLCRNQKVEEVVDNEYFYMGKIINKIGSQP